MRDGAAGSRIMSSSNNEPGKTRLFFLDWLRVFAFGLLVFYHAGLIFVEWGYPIQNDTLSEGLKYPLLFINQWRLPLLFFISGAGIWFALGRKTSAEFLKERFTRLVLPLLFGIIIVIPPQVYFERLDQVTFTGSYVEFYPQFFNGIYPRGNFTWNHLWFLAYLIVFVMIALPFFLYVRGRKKQNAGNPSRPFSSATRISLVTPVFFLFLIEYFLRDSWPDTRNLVRDWYNFSFYFVFFIYGFVISSHPSLWDVIERGRWTACLSGIVSFCLIFFGWHGPGENFLETSPTGLVFFRLFKCLNILSWIFAFLGFAKHHLSFTNPTLQYSNRAVYPFYILHQSVLIAIGYYIIRLDTGIFVKYGIVVAGTFAITLIMYDLVVRRTRLTKVVFGLK
jgi:hypothetical protein